MSDASVKNENKRKKEPVRRFNFETCPIIFRHLDVVGRLASAFCDPVLKNASAIFCVENFRVFGESLVGNARTVTRAGKLPGSANLRPVPSTKLRELIPKQWLFSTRNQDTRGKQSSESAYHSAANARLWLEAQAVCQTASKWFWDSKYLHGESDARVERKRLFFKRQEAIAKGM